MNRGTTTKSGTHSQLFDKLLVERWIRRRDGDEEGCTRCEETNEGGAVMIMVGRG